DAAGTTYIQPQQQLTTIDTRFTWQHLNRGLLQVNWYDRPQDFGQVILNSASSSIDRISGNLGGGLQSSINLWVYATDQDFQGSLPPGSYEWVGGIAFPELSEASIVVASIYDTTLSRDMPHELTHLVFHQLIGLQTSVPTWFDEGMAVFNQQFHEQAMIDRFNRALDTHSLLRLDNISFGFPADSDQAYLAYAQSWNLVQYMYTTFGQPKMIQFIKDLSSLSLDFNQAMLAALGIDPIHLENRWRLHLNQPGIALPPGEATPTPQITARPTSHPNGTGSASGDDRSWALILLGGALVLVALVGLIVLLVSLAARRKSAGTSPATNARPYSNGIPVPPFDPSIYARDSMYMRPSGASPQSMLSSASPPAQPVQPAPGEWSPFAAGQEYSGHRPGPSRPVTPPYPQAPQE
ncbi:MAG TPA: peptidase MA family metallohydrolase, partial [Ktedonobacteraceae bacterium]|nr:peptidase MA family metallohydrolase [Ktedonobacteraceae bacterium]